MLRYRVSPMEAGIRGENWHGRKEKWRATRRAMVEGTGEVLNYSDFAWRLNVRTSERTVLPASMAVWVSRAPEAPCVPMCS